MASPYFYTLAICSKAFQKNYSPDNINILYFAQIRQILAIE